MLFKKQLNIKSRADLFQQRCQSQQPNNPPDGNSGLSNAATENESASCHSTLSAISSNYRRMMKEKQRAAEAQFSSQGAFCRDELQEKLEEAHKAIKAIGSYVVKYKVDSGVAYDKFLKSDPLEIIFASYETCIQEVCAIACCLPCSQVSVERVFSALRFNMTNYRGKLGDDTLDAILFLRMNELYGLD